MSNTDIMDLVVKLAGLGHEPTTEQVQAVLTNEQALAIVTDTAEDSRAVVAGYVLNHQQCFSSDVVTAAQALYDDGQPLDPPVIVQIRLVGGDGQTDHESTAELADFLDEVIPGGVQRITA